MSDLTRTERRLGAVPVPRKFVIALVAVLLLILAGTGAWFGDLALRGMTERKVAGELQTVLGTTEAPTVSIGGWPFVTQAADRHLGVVTVDAGNAVPRNVDITLQRVHAVGRDVTFPADQKSLTIGSLDGDVSVSYAEASRLAGREVSFVEPDRLQIKAIPDILEQEVPVRVTGKPVVNEDGSLRLTEAEIEIIGVDLSPEISQQIVDNFGSIPLNLPAEVSPTTVTAEADGIGVAFTGAQITVQR